MTTSLTLDALLSHSDWVRRLAFQLVQDPHQADDLTQATYVVAMERPPRHAGNLKGWLASVLRSLWLQSARRESRRPGVESQAARNELEDSTATLVDRAQTQRSLSAEVLALSEPYRSTILLRFFEDLPPREIAAAQGVPVATVRTRLARGTELLRQRMDQRQQQDAPPWRALLAPLALPPARSAATASAAAGKTALPLALGAFLMNSKQVTVTALVLLAGLAAAWPFLGDAGDAPLPSTPVVSEDEGPVPAAMPATAEPVEGQRSASPLVTQVEREQPTSADDGPAMIRFTGRVVDASARAVRDLPVRTRGRGDSEDFRAVSTADGTFTMEVPDRRTVIEDDDPAVSTAMYGVLYGGRTIQPVVVVAPSRTVGGVLVDAAGLPIHSARVQLALPADFFARFPFALDGSDTRQPSTRCDDAGQFALADLAAVPGATLRVQSEGYLPHEEPLPDVDRDDLRIVLKRPDVGVGVLAGQVVDAVGTPVAGAMINFGRRETRSEEDGRFVLELKEAGETRTVTAVHRGYLPARHQIQDLEIAQGFVYLRLGAEPLQITGRLVDPDGEPVAGARLWVGDPDVLGSADGGLASLEGFLGGALTRGEVRERYFQDGRPTVDLEDLVQRQALTGWPWVLTDSDGRFSLDGLQDRPYTVCALDMESLVKLELPAVPAGTAGLQLVLPTGAVHPVIAGRVVSRDGKPIGGVRVAPQSDPMRLEAVGRAATTHASASSATTDGEGRFRLERVGRGAVYLRLDGDQILPLEYGRGAPDGVASVADRPLDDLRIQVGLRVRMRIELNDPNRADSISVLDELGRPLPINRITAGGRRTQRRVELTEGRSEVLTVGDNASTVILHRGDEEVGRLSVSLQPGDTNVVRG